MPDVDVEGPDGKTYSFPDGTDKNAAIKYFRAKGIGVPKPSIPAPAGTPSLASAPGGPSSQPGMSRVRTLTGTPYNPGPLESDVMDLAKGAAKQLADSSAPTIAHRVLQKTGVMSEKSRLYPEEGSLKDAAQGATMMVGLGAPEGLEAEAGASVAMPRGRTVSKPPGAGALDTETQAKYTSDLDKANADFKSQAQKYHEGTTKAFDEAKREQLEGQSQHEAATRKAIDEHKQNAQKYHEELSNTFDKAKRQQLEDAVQYEKEHGEWLEKSQAYHKAQAEAEAAATKQQELRSQSKGQVKATYDNLQQTYKTARGALDQRWGQFRQGMEGATLDPSAAFNSIEAAKAKYLKGSPASLQVFNNLAREMGIQEFMEGDGGALKAIPGSGELPFDTARVHYSAIGDKLAQGDLPGNVYHALKAVEDGLDKQLSSAAERRNLGKEYSSLKSEEHQFRSDWTDSKSPLAKAHGQLDPNFLEPQLLGRGNDYITKQLERYRKYGAQPHLPLAARRLAESAKELPKVKIPTAPGPEPTRPTNLPEHSAPKLARPATVPEPPGIPEKTPPRSPELKAVERPKPKPPQASKWAKKGGRVAGKIVGGAAGSSIGHPFIGYSIGGELGEEAAEQLAKRKRTVPPPPDE